MAIMEYVSAGQHVSLWSHGLCKFAIAMLKQLAVQDLRSVSAIADRGWGREDYAAKAVTAHSAVSRDQIPNH